MIVSFEASRIVRMIMSLIGLLGVFASQDFLNDG